MHNSSLFKGEFIAFQSLITSSYAVFGIHDLLQEFFSYLWFLPVAPQEVVKEHEIWWPCRPGTVHGSKQLTQQRGQFVITIFYYVLTEISWLTVMLKQHS